MCVRIVWEKGEKNKMREYCKMGENVGRQGIEFMCKESVWCV